MFFHAATTTFETPCSWVFTKEGMVVETQYGASAKEEA